MLGTVMMSNATSTTTVAATSATTTSSMQLQQQQQQQQQQQLYISSRHNRNQNMESVNSNNNNNTNAGHMSDTDMSEVGTVKSGRSGMRSNRHHNHHHHGTSGSVVSFDQSSSSNRNYNRCNNNDDSTKRSRHHHSQHHQTSNNNLIMHKSRHNSQRSVNFQQNEQQPLAIDLNKTETKMLNKAQPTAIVSANDALDAEANDERIQVQILAQDDNWGENTTAYTGATSEFSDFNDDNMTEDGRSCKNDNFIININHLNSGAHESGFKRFCSRYMGFICTIIISFCTYITPILFIILPRINMFNANSQSSSVTLSSASSLGQQQWLVSDCGIECEGLLIGIAFKLFLLLLGVWALYLRRPKATLPRVYELRVLILFLLCILTFSYWLFYGVRIIDTRQNDYYKILQFAVSYVDVLLFIYIVSVFLIEIRQLQPQYVVKIVRSPDGKQHEYSIGKMSIQRAAVFLLEQYYKDFPVYNPWLENAHAHKKRLNIELLQSAPENNTTITSKKSTKSGATSFKYYNVDTCNELENDQQPPPTVQPVGETGEKHNTKKSNLIALPAVRGNNTNHNDRFYEEYEYERRLRKRRARLLTSCEEAFTHIRRIQKDQCPQTIMDPQEAAQAIFTSIARELRRYLRITRQQPYFTRDNIVNHLADCISYDMSPRSFLQRYLQSESIIFNQRALLQGNGNSSCLQLLNQKNTATNNNNTTSSSTNTSSTSGKIFINLNKFKTPEQSWILICDTVLYQNVEDNLMLVLKQNEISLMCTFKRMPYFNLIEDILDPKRNKFVLKMNSETSV